LIETQHLAAFCAASVAGLVQWLSWRWIADTRNRRMTKEVGRVVVWLVLTFVFQSAVLLLGIIVFRKIAGAYLACWGIVFMAVTTREILRLHRGNTLS
jgi:hypothetical protein